VNTSCHARRDRGPAAATLIAAGAGKARRDAGVSGDATPGAERATTWP